MSYISSLNLLNADSPAPVNEELFQEELSLWANAQFSFDTTPGTALVDEDNNKESILDTLNKLTQLVQPQPQLQSYSFDGLPRLAPAPGGTHPQIEKRPFEQVEEDITVEDDKRRRNTAASARFRLKKKMREQALEKKSNELAENVERLENKVKELEMEAKWLRDLVLEKDPSLLTKNEMIKNESS